MRHCILDCDNILWPLASYMQPIFVAKFGVPAELSSEWNWYKEWMSEADFYGVVDEAHSRQLEHQPFDGAAELFEALDESGYQIIVASHRNHRAAADLAAWITFNLSDKWSGVYTGPDKHWLIQKGDLVIDDAPHTIAYANSVGAEPWTLIWPWNESSAARKFKNLHDMAAAVRQT